jgi:hypothetical protein
VAQFDSSAITADNRSFKKNECVARKPLYFRGFMAHFDGA